MSDVAELVKDLSTKLDNLQDLLKKFENLRAEVDNIKRNAKRKKSKKHSRHSRKSRSWSRSISTPPSQQSNARGHSSDSRSGAHGAAHILGAEHVVTLLATGAHVVPSALLPPPGEAFPQLVKPGAAQQIEC